MRLGHPSVLFGDWRKYFDAVRVVRAGALGGRKVYGIQLESAGLPPVLVAVDAETGDVLQDQQTISFAEAGAMRVTTTYSDYRDVGGMRVPHRHVASTDLVGRTIYEVERVEVGVTLAPDIFTLRALTVSGGKRLPDDRWQSQSRVREKRPRTKRATLRPRIEPSRSELRKWNPTEMRARSTSFTTSSK